MRAVVASLLEVELEAVPNFSLLSENVWWPVFECYLLAHGWDYLGVMNFDPTGENRPNEEESIGGYFQASVPSKSFAGETHAVIINAKGFVIHDPSPTKSYQGENVFETKRINYWYRFKKLRR